MLFLRQASLAGLLLIISASFGMAQVSNAQATSSLLTIVPDRLYAETLYGKRLEADLSEARAALIAENRRLDEDLSAEERALADQRADMVPEEFRALADAFDAKVQTIRSTQDTKQRDLTNR
ncbi:MAG: OmpH family outer membrane protein, partial [Halocynthiibacter sp.]